MALSDFDTQVQADEFEDPFDFDDDSLYFGDEDWYEFDSEYPRGYPDEDDYPYRDADDYPDDSFPMYLEYEGPFGLGGYDEY
jgi:hypothetical protein